MISKIQIQQQENNFTVTAYVGEAVLTTETRESFLKAQELATAMAFFNGSESLINSVKRANEQLYNQLKNDN